MSNPTSPNNELKIGDRVLYVGEGESGGPGTVTARLLEDEEVVLVVRWDNAEEGKYAACELARFESSALNLRRFMHDDWFAWQGAEPFITGAEPIIGEVNVDNEVCEIVISAAGIDIATPDGTVFTLQKDRAINVFGIQGGTTTKGELIKIGFEEQ